MKLFLNAAFLLTGAMVQGMSSQKGGVYVPSVLFQKPLIIGASVSADHSTPSPGKVLSLRHTDARNILTRARSGAKGLQMMAQLKDEDLQGRSVVIGVDLLFWDATLPDCHESLKAFEQLADKAMKLEIPLVIGDVPTLMPSRQPCAARINQALHSRASKDTNLRVLGLESLRKEIVSKGHLKVGDRRFTLQELLPDGLHVNAVASNFLADKIAELF